ncbi:MAG: cell division protein ZapE [Geminicoccaceae bacterium]
MPLAAYRLLIENGELRPDPLQEAAAVRLDRLARELKAAPPPQKAGGFLQRLGLGREPEAAAVPRGVYLHGDVGRGKSMLMDLFAAELRGVPLRRVHFHAFMLEVQRRLHGLRERGAREDPLQRLAAELAGEQRVLCFDEFHVVNIADAMILGRLFEGLFARGVVMVATSNWSPGRLYENGLNRDRFLPFIALLETKVDVLALDGRVDYRLERLRDLPVYRQPLGPEADASLDAAFTALTDGAEPGAVDVAVGTRTLQVPLAAGGVARFEFADLCHRALGAADYLALTERFHTLFLDHVPLLTPDRRNEARRFMTLIDALYERRMMLFLSAEAPAERLYPTGDGAFEFQRTVSRLLEMQSSDWLTACRQRRPDELPKTFAPYALTSDLN